MQILKSFKKLWGKHLTPRNQVSSISFFIRRSDRGYFPSAPGISNYVIKLHQSGKGSVGMSILPPDWQIHQGCAACYLK